MQSTRYPLALRLACVDDVPHFERWDRDPDVIAATSDDPNAQTAFADADWRKELTCADPHGQYWVAELSGHAFGAMQVIDPALEATHYWGNVEHGLRALDIWIGERDLRSRGYGSEMMRLMLDRCFAQADVQAVLVDPLHSNARAHRFYRRLGFKPLERRLFDGDDCLVHRLRRQEYAVTGNPPEQTPSAGDSR